MNSEIRSIFGDFIEIEDVKIPVSHLEYKGTSNTYVVWTILDDIPTLMADDEVLYSVVQVDFDIYSDTNYLKIMKKIKKLMKTNEWVWVEDSAEMIEDDTHLYHKTCTFEKERMIENG